VRTGAAAALAGALAAAACGRGEPAPFAEGDLSIRASLGAEEAAVGRGVPLTVVRTWREDLVPEPFRERALVPLTVRLESLGTREGEGKVEETRRYRAYAFRRDDVAVRALRVRARPRDGGDPVVATAAPLSLRVRREVDAAAPGEPELPEAPPPPSGGVLPAALAALAAAAVLGAVVVARRRRGRALRAPPPVPPEPAPDEAAHVRALADLRNLRARPDADPVARAAVVEEAAAVLRRYVEARFALPAARRTTREVMADLALPPERATRSGIEAVLRAGDLVKYAGHLPTADEREAVLFAGADFVSRTTGDWRPS
jgi:hypothetical protein